MRYDLAKTQEALDNVESLYSEVASGYFIPKKFRKKPFTESIKRTYLDYLSGIIERLRADISSSKPRAPRTAALRVLTPVQPNAQK